MADEAHFLEQIADALGGEIAKEVDFLATALSAPGGRPLFTERKTAREALTWWRKHYSDEYGQAVLKGYSPLQVMELNARLAQADEQAQGRGDYGGSEPQDF